MKVLKWILIVIAVLILLAAAFLAYMGLFGSLQVVEKEMGPYTFIYERYVGPYQDTGKTFEKVYKAAKDEGLKTVNGIGIYYDDPASVSKDKLRSDCGVIIEEKDLGKVPLLKKKYKIMTIPKKLSLVAEFTIRNNLSYMIGPMKGYPALVGYANKKGYKMARTYEFYDMPNNKIYFVMELAK